MFLKKYENFKASDTPIDDREKSNSVKSGEQGGQNYRNIVYL